MKNSQQTMKTRSTIFLLVLLAVLPSAQAAEPEYRGKALSEWLVDQDREARREAIQQIGTNGLPVLLDLVSVGEKNRRKVAGQIKSKDIKESLQDSRPDFREAIRGMAVDGFAILGTNAEPAIPQLSRRLHSDPDGRLEITRALLRVGPKGFAVLTNVVNDPNDGARNTVIWAIGEERGGDTKAITRILVSVLQDPDWANRGNAARFLAGRDAELAVPALISILEKYKDDIYTVEGVSQALAGYGPAAKAAVPTLFAIYTNAVVNTDARTAKSWGEGSLCALRSIDIETAKRAEEFLVNSGPLNYARRGYSRTKLPNDMELLAGGVIDTGIITLTNHFLASAQLLDPKTGKWTETGKMNIARFDHKATLLPDGKVLVEGGNGEPSIPGRYPPSLSSKELYDPVTGTWTVVTNK
jgi:HEAT repeat protein